MNTAITTTSSKTKIPNTLKDGPKENTSLSVHEVAVEAVLTELGVKSSENNQLAFDATGVTLIFGKDKKQVSYERAYEKIGIATSYLYEQLKLNANETRMQAHGWYIASLVAASLGIILIIIATLILIISDEIATGIIIAISSAIPDAAAALFFRQSNLANNQIENIRSSLEDAAMVKQVVDISNSLSDSTMRNDLKVEIVRRVLSKN